jgi:hypothetical protein
MRGENNGAHGRFPLAEQVAAPGIHFGGRRPPVEPLANDYRAIFTSPCLSTLSEFCQVARTGQNVSSWQILLRKSAMTGAWPLARLS